jgi:hypothetical protein
LRGRRPGNGFGNDLRLASSANETGPVKNLGPRRSWDGDAAGVRDHLALYRVAN